MTRAEAKAEGLKTFQGNPCQQGHTEKWTISGSCVECKRAHQQAPKARRAAHAHNRTLARKAQHWVRQGLPHPTHECPESCENPGCVTPLPYAMALHNDHDHVTGKFRGWLCVDCNTGIGKLGDTIEGLEAAIKYLKKAA